MVSELGTGCWTGEPGRIKMLMYNAIQQFPEEEALMLPKTMMVSGALVSMFALASPQEGPGTKDVPAAAFPAFEVTYSPFVLRWLRLPIRGAAQRSSFRLHEVQTRTTTSSTRRSLSFAVPLGP